MASLKHTHQYIRVNGTLYFRCAHPDCSHREKKLFIKGKKSVCNKCMQDFILDYYTLKLAKPICLNCQKTTEGKKHRAVKEVLVGLFPEEEQL